MVRDDVVDDHRAELFGPHVVATSVLPAGHIDAEARKCAVVDVRSDTVHVAELLRRVSEVA